MKHKLSSHELTELVYRITGQIYTFAVADGKWCGLDSDTAYQLMPHTFDTGFFDWYCLERVNDQFFANKEDCTLNFLKYWFKWQEHLTAKDLQP
jgi:hypothetical protein